MPPHDGLTNGWAESSFTVRGGRFVQRRTKTICLPRRWIVSQHKRQGSRVCATGQRAICRLGLSRLPQRRKALRHKRRGSDHSGDLPPHQGSALRSLAAPEANRPFRDSLTHKNVVLFGNCRCWRYCGWKPSIVAIDQASVRFSTLPLLLRTSSRLTNILTCDFPQ
jgi:hypothetical protein